MTDLEIALSIVLKINVIGWILVVNRCSRFLVELNATTKEQDRMYNEACNRSKGSAQGIVDALQAVRESNRVPLAGVEQTAMIKQGHKCQCKENILNIITRNDWRSYLYRPKKKKTAEKY